MKKLAVAFALLLASLALVACGGGDSTTSGETTSEGAGGGETTQKPEGGQAQGGAAAGGQAEGGTAGAAGTLKFEADPTGKLEFTTKEATAKPGKVMIDFTNPSPLPHDVAIEEPGGETIAKTEVITGGSDSTTAELKPGEYTFYCSVPGHREAGMEGKLTVK
jgi:plastocyanin